MRESHRKHCKMNPKKHFNKCKRCKKRYHPGPCKDDGMCPMCISDLVRAGTIPRCVLGYSNGKIYGL